LVEDYPSYTPGHVLLSHWYAYDSAEAVNASEGLRLINLCLRELRLAERVKVTDLHHWVMIHHCKGLIYSYILDSLGEVEKGIKAFEDLLSRRPRLEVYYTKRLPFFPKWLWPNVWYFLGLA